MQNNQMLIAIILVLAVVIGLISYDRYQRPETVGEKVGQTIDKAVNKMDNAIDRHK